MYPSYPKQLTAKQSRRGFELYRGTLASVTPRQFGICKVVQRRFPPVVARIACRTRYTRISEVLVLFWRIVAERDRIVDHLTKEILVQAVMFGGSRQRGQIEKEVFSLALKVMGASFMNIGRDAGFIIWYQNLIESASISSKSNTSVRPKGYFITKKF
ncbi:hypothetical protein BDZ45DRAFT_686526 [Acephala macrosclerotiorum]|nr:hypothetical protein BDZ45DRAFT_686526 [Acephala macrosclerotiorum]